MRGLPNQQGDLDALCGIYALVHFLRDRRDFATSGIFSDGERNDTSSRGKVAFRLLLETADRLKILNADNLVEGFYSFQLVEIFNALCEPLELDFHARTLAAYRREFPDFSTSQIVERVIAGRGRVILALRDGHWALANKVDGSGKISFADSDGSDRAATLTAEAVNKLDRNMGVVLLRQSKRQAK